MNNKKTVLITGASSGIGLELTKLFARDNHNLVLVARSEGKLNALAQKLKEKYDIQITIIARDLSDPSTAKEIFDILKEKNIVIDILINNAGFGLYGEFQKTDLTKELKMIDLNISTLVALTKIFLPDMIERKSGKIMNVASTAAFEPGPGMSIYYASKAFVLSFSEAIAEELKNTGVTVTALCPGPTKTGFESAADMHFPKMLKVMNVEEVAYIGYRGLMKEKRVVIPGFRNKLLPFLIRFTPRNLVTKITSWIQNNQS